MSCIHLEPVDVNGINGNWTPSNSSAVTITNIDCSGINQSSSLNVTQTATGIDLNSDGALTAGEAIRYDITVTNSGNTTITGLDFLSIFQPGGSKTFSISDLSKYLPSQNNRGDGFIIPGAQAASHRFTPLHTMIVVLDNCIVLCRCNWLSCMWRNNTKPNLYFSEQRCNFYFDKFDRS